MNALTLTVLSAASEGPVVAYRLRKKVRCCLDSGPKPLLILDFPLRAMAVQPCWRPLLEFMSTTDFVPVQKLNDRVPDISCDLTEIFLEHLVRT